MNFFKHTISKLFLQDFVTNTYNLYEKDPSKTVIESIISRPIDYSFVTNVDHLLNTGDPSGPFGFNWTICVVLIVIATFTIYSLNNHSENFHSISLSTLDNFEMIDYKIVKPFTYLSIVWGI